MLSIPSRKAVPGATISSALTNPGSGRASVSNSSPDREATTSHSTAFSLFLSTPSPVRRVRIDAFDGSREGKPEFGVTRPAPDGVSRWEAPRRGPPGESRLRAPRLRFRMAQARPKGRAWQPRPGDALDDRPSVALR